MNDDAKPDGLATETRTLATLVYQRLRSDIVNCRLRPGEPLRFEVLKQAYGVGVSPLREALSRLSSDGLVTFADKRGFRVAVVSADELRDVTKVRQRLECMALRESLASSNTKWEEELVVAWHHLSRVPERDASEPAALNEEWEHRHRTFHRALTAACDLRWLMRFIDQLYDQTDRYRRLSARNSNVARDVEGEHRAIFEAAIARDAELACGALEQHLGRTAEIVLADNANFEPPPLPREIDPMRLGASAALPEPRTNRLRGGRA